MVYAATHYRQQRIWNVFNLLALAGLAFPGTAVQAGSLQSLLFEPQALTETAAAHSGPLQASTPAPAAQPATANPERVRAITEYANRISTVQDEQGPYAVELAEHYLALGQLYQEAADYDSALGTYAKAEHIARMNHGLDAPEQYLPIELSIDCHLAKHDFRMALERQEYLVYLQREHYGYDAAEVVPELLALGNLYFDAFERGVQRDPASSDLQLQFGPESDFKNPQDLSAIDAAFLWLEQANNHYFTSIKSLVSRQDFANPLLQDLETSLIETLFLQAFRRNIELDPVYFISTLEPDVRDMLRFEREREQIPLYRNGEEAFTRILTYLRMNPAVEPAQVAKAMLELGDWHLLFGKDKRGLAQYEAARAYLAASGASEAEVAALLNPAVPVQLPTFMELPNSHARLAPEADVVFDGYIDVALTLDRTGQVESIKVLDKSANADAAIEARLKRVLRNAPFRPRISPVAAAETVALRYNFAQL